ncbi:MAG TPA: competence/damage-inducible protein A [Clostridiales bacterium]|nr:competence/damage-inducible protein A [Clostridiales bacterium]
MNGEIISVGTELLLGQIANTNAQYISQALSKIGVNVYFHTVVGDNPQRIKDCFKRAYDRSDLVIITGGLGPTSDDITKEVLAEFFGVPLVINEECERNIKEFFKKIGKPCTANNLKQAYILQGATVIPNNNGTAPGILYKKNEKLFFLLPGPPDEMKGMIDRFVLPYLAKSNNSIIKSKVLKIIGIGESSVEEMLKDIITSQKNPTIAPLAGGGEVTIRITAKAENEEEGNILIKETEHLIRKRLKNNIYGQDDDTIEQVVVNELKALGYMLSIAESCTGGLVANLITNVPGASHIFDRGFITYSNESKVELLGVPREIIEKNGAVSPQTAKAMAEGLLSRTSSNMALAVTGIAGPGGGTPEKPVGLVYVAVADRSQTRVSRFNFVGNRQRNKLMTAKYALNTLRLFIQSNGKSPKND